MRSWVCLVVLLGWFDFEEQCLDVDEAVVELCFKTIRALHRTLVRHALGCRDAICWVEMVYIKVKVQGFYVCKMTIKMIDK